VGCDPFETPSLIATGRAASELARYFEPQLRATEVNSTAKVLVDTITARLEAGRPRVRALASSSVEVGNLVI
jgi:hypothetical protein